MKDYTAPLGDMRFILREIAPLEEINQLPGCGDVTMEVADAILTEAGKFATSVLSPLNPVGDREGARWDDGEVHTATGWREAYAGFTEAGWNALSCDVAHGGQGAPRLVSALVEEIWNGANVSFTLCPMLTHGAIEALELSGSEAQKAMYLPKLISGEWAGTMVLTEPQAGSDLAAVRTRAVPRGDGTYLLEGQKIFITYGEHDLAANIIHLVLARTPDAPPGVKGISLFVVPKFIVEADGSLGARNDIRCVSLEHKLGIHASPTAVLALGDKGGAVGWLVGQENRGIEYMFIMMNAARYAVGLQGIGLCELAYQQALWYSRERVQGSELGSKSREGVAIIRHPDVRRMLMLMKSQTEAMRAVACVTAAAADTARCHPDAERRAASQAFVDLMIPIVKGWSTENSVDIASLGIQVHGGMGYIEETGAAQIFRDARITTIYEGTTGIQAADLMGRKVARDGGATIRRVIAEMRQVQAQLEAESSPDLTAIAARLRDGVAALDASVEFVLSTYGKDVRRASVGAVPFLTLFGTVAGGWQMARSALAAHRHVAAGRGDGFLRAKLATARFYADQVLTRAEGLSQAVVGGAEGALAIEDEHF
ncbi:MAG: acyl-CoA dehydrogenase domain protein [Anaeromyxobacteraceae bacterium]|nr:acyl-CoA dehydrogenase domain protein [Anaeromyxobacteraceae bacterium]